MTKEPWTAVDRYLTDLFVPSDPLLDAALQAAADAGLPPINVAPNQGKQSSTPPATTKACRACGASTPHCPPKRV